MQDSYKPSYYRAFLHTQTTRAVMAQVNPPVFRIPDNDAHGRVSALFLGPKAENADRLLQYLTTLVDGQEKQ